MLSPHPRWGWVYLSLICLVWALYGRTLWFSITYMDDGQILDGAYETLNTGISAFSTNALFKPGIADFYRPLQNLSLLLDARIAAGESYIPFHTSNVLLFTLAAILLVRLLSTWGYTRMSAWCFATLFVVSPMNVQAVAWIPGRGDLLLACAALLWLLTVPGSRPRLTWRAAVLHSLATVLALASKENGFVLPLLGLAYGVLLAKPRWSRLMMMGYAGVALLLGLLYAFLRIRFLGGALDQTIFSAKNLLYNIYFLPTCLAQALIPLKVTAVPLYEIVPIILGSLLLAAYVYAILRSSAAHKRRLLFASIWIVLFAFPGLFYRHEFGTHAYDYLNHRILILLVGMVLAAAELCTWLIPRRAPLFVASAAGAIALWHAGVAISFTNWFKDPDTLLSAGIQSRPSCTFLLNNRGVWRQRQGDLDGAGADYDRAIQHGPAHPAFFRNRGSLRGDTGDVEGAIEDLSVALTLDPADVDALLGRAHWHAMRENFAQARMDLDRAIALEPNNSLAHSDRGILELTEGDFAAAIDDFSAAIRANPALSVAYYNRGRTLYEMGDISGSCKDLEQAARLGFARALDLSAQWCGGEVPSP